MNKELRYFCDTCNEEVKSTHAWKMNYTHSILVFCQAHEKLEDSNEAMDHCQYCGGPNH